MFPILEAGLLRNAHLAVLFCCFHWVPSALHKTYQAFPVKRNPAARSMPARVSLCTTYC